MNYGIMELVSYGSMYIVLGFIIGFICAILSGLSLEVFEIKGEENNEIEEEKQKIKRKRNV